VLALLADAGHGAVAGAEDGIVREGEDFLAIGAEGVLVADHAAAHGAGEEGIADNCDGTGKTIDDPGDAATGMAPGEAAADAEGAEGEFAAGLDGFSFGQGLAAGDEDGGAGGLAKAVEIEDVIAVGVGEEDGAEREAGGAEFIEDAGGIAAGIEGGGLFGGGVPDEVGVDRHVAEGGVELGEAVEIGDGGGGVAILAEIDEGAGIEAEDGGGEAGGVLVEMAGAKALDGLDGKSCARGDGAIGKAETTGGFADDVGEIIFEGNGHRRSVSEDTPLLLDMKAILAQICRAHEPERPAHF
jgi:hypothetical protein